MNAPAWVIQTTKELFLSPPSRVPEIVDFGGVFMSGCAYISDNRNDFKNTLLSIYALNNNAGDMYIYNCYMIPKIFVDWNEVDTNVHGLYSGQHEPMSYSYSFNKPTSLDGYVPINKKLLTYPYCYLLLSNNAGATNILQYEKFNTSPNDTCEFEITGIPTASGSIKCSPLEYGISNNTNEEQGIPRW